MSFIATLVNHRYYNDIIEVSNGFFLTVADENKRRISLCTLMIFVVYVQVVHFFAGNVCAAYQCELKDLVGTWRIFF